MTKNVILLLSTIFAWWSRFPKYLHHFRYFQQFVKDVSLAFQSSHKRFETCIGKSRLVCTVIFLQNFSFPHCNLLLTCYKAISSQSIGESKKPATLKKNLFATEVDKKLKIFHYTA